MNWARKSPAGEAIVVLKTDDTTSKDILAEICKIDGIAWAENVEL